MASEFNIGTVFEQMVLCRFRVLFRSRGILARSMIALGAPISNVVGAVFDGSRS